MSNAMVYSVKDGQIMVLGFYIQQFAQGYARRAGAQGEWSKVSNPPVGLPNNAITVSCAGQNGETWYVAFPRPERQQIRIKAAQQPR